MKKGNLAIGILYVLAGAACLVTALFTESRLDGLLFGLAGGGIAPGALLIGKYIYYGKPENKERYLERLEWERIELHDEMKERLRDRAGRYAYLLGLLVIAVTIVVFSVLGALGIVGNSRTLVLFLGGYLIFQYGAGIAVFKHLLRKC